MQRTPGLVVMDFLLILGVRFCMDFCIEFREFFFRRFRVPGFFRSFSSSLSFFSSSSGGRPGFCSCLLVFGPQDTGLPVPAQAGAART